MIFITKNYYNDKYENKLVTAPVILRARRYIILRRFGADEIQLSRYLVSKYKKDLRRVCLELLMRAKVMKNFNKELIIIFQTKEDENLAKLITYGNGVITGSNILRNALS